jgi:hypothetical protein
MTFEQLHHLVEAASDQRLSPAYPIYELRAGFLPFSRRSRSLAERQQRVFGALRQLVGWPAFLHISESPLDMELPGSWGHAARDTWSVPRDVESAQLLGSLLTPGSWKLYLSPEGLDPSSLPDLFRGSLPEAYATVEGIGVPALLDAFHGNTEWRILLQPAAAAKRAAA